MTTSASPDTVWPEANPRSVARAVVIVVLAAWLGIVIVLGAAGAYVGAPGQPPLRLFASAAVPMAGFAVAARTRPAFREFLLELDVRWIVGIQAWRFAGFGFVALYANHVLPGLFAWPAGLGDMAIAAIAPWWIVSLSKRPETAASSKFRLWNALGILDLVVAFSTATICAITLTPDVSPSIAPMGQLPLVLIPAFMVPIFVMLHIVALLQSSRVRA